MVQPQAVIERIGELTDGDAVVVTDVGQHQMWTAQYYPYQNERQLVTSGGLGTMDLVFQQQLVLKLLILIKKLSSLLVMVVSKMTNQELAILNIYKVSIKVVMLNKPLTWYGTSMVRVLLRRAYIRVCL